MLTRQTVLGFRTLLARLREVMSKDSGGASRLATVADVVAEEFAADVCSIYVRRAGEVLELFATRGLRPAAVHVTRLRFGEGLVGKIAASGQPLADADAPQHPGFVYRQETGEDPFRSFLGVPILGNGRVLGVLAIQNRYQRRYTDVETEVLETVATVLAGLIAGGDVVALSELTSTEGIALSTLRLEGLALTKGFGIGIAVAHQPRFAVREAIADDSRVEHERLRSAVADLHGDLDAMLDIVGALGERDTRDVLEAYRMIAADVGWLSRIGDAIDSGLTAEAAVQKVCEEIRARLGQASEPYLRERAHDFEELANRLLRGLVGEVSEPPEALPDDVVLVARNLGPAELLDYDWQRLRGIILEEGSPSSHATIVARALDIPVLGQVRNALGRIDAGEPVIVDADHDQAFIRPGDDMRQAFVGAIKARRDRIASYAAARDLPAVSRDGVRLSVEITAGLLVDLGHLDEFGADGVGLYRTEVPFLVRSSLPDVDSQVALYRRVLAAVHGKPVVFRTLDIGGDKMLPYWGWSAEENPAMGWRGIRIALDRPAMLRQQLRAMIRAAVGGDLAVMFPMVSRISEFTFCRGLIDRELDRRRQRGEALPRSVRVGAMIEVPALMYQLDRLLPQVDFLSLGANDFLQFLFAGDRNNARVAAILDPLSPVFLRIVRDLVEKCRAARVPLTMCGEMAGRPLDALALIGVGVRRFSVSPFAVGPVKSMIRTLEIASLENYLTHICDLPDDTIRSALTAYARDHAITI